LTIALFRLNDHSRLLANGHAVERLLQAGDDLIVALQKLERFLVGRGINDFSLLEAEGIV
jgi:hypothetical protein